MAEAPHGIDLRLLRVAARVTVGELAREAGWKHQRVTTLEEMDRPTEAATRRYLAALERCR
jgi:hypothetical protein